MLESFIYLVIFQNIRLAKLIDFLCEFVYNSLKLTDMGSSEWQVEGFANRPHKQRSWPRIFTEAPLPIFVRGGSTSQMLGSGI